MTEKIIGLSEIYQMFLAIETAAKVKGIKGDLKIPGDACTSIFVTKVFDEMLVTLIFEDNRLPLHVIFNKFIRRE